jgi:DNA-binding transcriptional regulator YiaG
MERDWKQLYEAEYAIVARVWKALGITTFEEAKGKSIDEIVVERSEKLDTEIARIREVLSIARDHIATLGGDSSGLLTEAEAQECSVDMIQWKMLRLLDEEVARI